MASANPTIRDLVPLLHDRYGTDAAILLGRDGLIIDAKVRVGTRLDAETLAALVPGVVSAANHLGDLKVAVLELASGYAIVSVASQDALLLVLTGDGTKLPTLLRDIRAHRENIERLI